MTPIQTIAATIAEVSGNFDQATHSIEEAKKAGRAGGCYQQDALAWRCARNTLEDALSRMRPQGARDLLVLALALSRRAAAHPGDTIDSNPTVHGLHRRLIEGLTELAGVDAASIGLASHLTEWWEFPVPAGEPVLAIDLTTPTVTGLEAIRREIADIATWQAVASNEDVPVAARSALEGAAARLVPESVRDAQVLATLLWERVASDNSYDTGKPDHTAMARNLVAGLSRITGQSAVDLGMGSYVESALRLEAHHSKASGAAAAAFAHAPAQPRGQHASPRH